MKFLDFSGWISEIDFKKIDYINLSKYLPPLALFIYLYIYKLSTIVTGASIGERLVNTPKLGLVNIINDPSYLGLKIVRYIFGFFNTNVSIFEVRLASVFFGLISIFLIYKIIYSWLGAKAAIVGATLFSFSAWTLHVSRLATNSIAYLFCVLAVIYSIVLIKKYYLNKTYFLTMTALIWPLLIFTPGMLFYVLFAIYRTRDELKKGFSNLKKPYYINIVSVVATLGILAKYLLTSSQNIFNILGLNTTLLNLENLPLNIVKTLYHLFLFGPNTPELWLNKAPVLDFFILLSSIFGIYFYLKNVKKGPAITLFSLFAIGLVLSSIPNKNDLSLLIPIMYIFSATGIALFLQRWLRVFPRNPIAKAVGYGLILIVIALSCIYNYRSYFIAWPHNQDTKSYFISIN